MKIITVIIAQEYDIILVRQRAKRIAALAGLTLTDQTRFVTGVSEIARNALMYAEGGKAEFFVIQKNGNQFLQVIITDNGTEAIDLDQFTEPSFKSKTGMGIGIAGTRNLVDFFTIQPKPGAGNIITLAKKIPFSNGIVTPRVIEEWVTLMAQETTGGFVEEIQQQNQILMQALEKLEEQEKELKKQLDESNRLNSQLENANQELKDFAYIVSHDLKAPLRGISSLAEWISNDYQDKIDDEGKKMLNLLAGRIQRMNNLIDGILQYSRIGRVTEERVEADLNKVVIDVISMLDSQSNIEIRIENSLPVVRTEETRIIQVFQNLIGNAVKYMDKPQGMVRVGSRVEGEFWVIYVADNGPGINEKYFEKIFKIFQTLHPRDKVESTGVGLTIVKKIVELYGGRVWLESKVGSGTTFFFTLPRG